MAHADPVTLTLREAAVVAGVPVRAVNRMIDAGALPRSVIVAGPGERRLRPGACHMVRFNATTGLHLSKAKRELALRWMREAGPALVEMARHGRAQVALDDGITLDLSGPVADTRRRLEELEAAKALVVSDPDIRGGMLTLKGTRLGVYEVAGAIEAGSEAEASAMHPTLTPELARAAVLYAKAHPRPGRPRRSGGAATWGGTLVSSRTLTAEELAELGRR